MRIWTFRNVNQVQKLRRMPIWGCPLATPSRGPHARTQGRGIFYVAVWPAMNTYGGQAGSRASLGESCTSCTDRAQVEIAFCLIPFQTIPPAGATSLRHDTTPLTLAARIVRPLSAVAPPSLLASSGGRTWIISAAPHAYLGSRLLYA